MTIAKRIAGWREMPREKHYVGAGRMFEEDTIAALRDRLRDTAAALEDSLWCMAHEPTANDARAILARLAEEGLVGEQEDET